MKVEGGCFCQSVRYEAVVDPETVAICHCTDCQTHSGAAYGVVVGILEEEFHLLSGELKIYKKVADSGTVRALAFCPDCGTRLYAKTVGEGSTFFGLRVGNGASERSAGTQTTDLVSVCPGLGTQFARHTAT